MLFIEPLESRIAPASLTGADKILTYTDFDGDIVKITFSVPMDGNDFTFVTNGVTSTGLDGVASEPQSLKEVNLTGKTGAGFTLVATPQKTGGNGHADINFIDGTNTDLGTISVDGDVETFAAGTGAAGTVGLKSFTALSMGRDGTHATNTLKNVGTFTIKSDVLNEQMNFDGGAQSIVIGGNLAETRGATSSLLDIVGDVGSIKIGGSIIGESSGAQNLIVTGTAKSVNIGGSVIGGSATLTPSGNGQLSFGGAVGSFAVGGDLLGETGEDGGSVDFQSSVGTLKIGGSVIGGPIYQNGYIFAGNVQSLSIGGSLDGTQSTLGGVIFADKVGTLKIGGSFISSFINGDSFGSIDIGHDLIGGDSTGNSSVNEKGLIYSTGDIGSLTIGGSFIAGRILGTGSFDALSSTIIANGIIGTIKIGGGIIGDSTHLAKIIASGEGATGGTAGTNAIKSLSVAHSVESTSILTGYTVGAAGTYTAENTNAGIGSVTIGGNLSGSFITVGSSAGADNIPGTADDAALQGSTATIGSVKIGGAFTGLIGSATNFHILAPTLLSLTIGHATYLHAALVAPGISFDSIGNALAESAG